METRKKNIDEFFEAYEMHFNDAIAGRPTKIRNVIQNSFADFFIESSPSGIVCAKNDDKFTSKIKNGLEFYRNIGSAGMKIKMKDITYLDNLHALVKVRWRYAYLVEMRSGTVDFDIFYVLRTEDSDVKIITYVVGDEQRALEERGLILEKRNTFERELVSSEEF